ncbi:MAG TPA: HIT family protein [Nitrosopumilaceae archaeon]|nr:HIT family protein [Nitrosopumilaceae archaeon]
MNCIFCDILKGTKKAHFIHEDKSHVAILDKYPIQLGHTLVIPRDHHEKITDMNTENVSSLFSRVPAIARAILEVTKADGFNIGQNNGKAANQIIPHVHVHIIPRYSDTGTGWTKRMISNEADLENLAAKIRKCIQSVQ